MQVFAIAKSYVGMPIIGNGQCVTFVRYCCPELGPTGDWVKGLDVMTTDNIPIGTAIATFDNKGQYQHEPTGQHTGFYIGKESRKDKRNVMVPGLLIIEQYRGLLAIKLRWIPVVPIVMLPNGMPKDASNIANAYSIVELRAKP